MRARRGCAIAFGVLLVVVFLLWFFLVDRYRIFYDYKTVDVLVVDSRTGSPMPGAMVHAVYLTIVPLPVPWSDDTKATGEDGTARLLVACEWGVDVHVAAPGHESSSRNGYAIASISRELLQRVQSPVAKVEIAFFGTNGEAEVKVTPSTP